MTTRTSQPPSASFESCLLDPSQQFGVSLDWILDNQSVSIPPIMTQCVPPPAARVVRDSGIRKAANAASVKVCSETIGREGDRDALCSGCHPGHCDLNILLREMSEPLTFDLFESILTCRHSSREQTYLLSGSDKIRSCRNVTTPSSNTWQRVLVLVNDRSDMNKMTASNLAVVSGPSWPGQGTSS